MKKKKSSIIKSKRRIKVSKSQIERGIPKSPELCPISIALTDSMGLYCSVGILNTIIYSYDNNRESFIIKENLRSVISKYDSGKGMNPLTLLLSPSGTIGIAEK